MEEPTMSSPQMDPRLLPLSCPQTPGLAPDRQAHDRSRLAAAACRRERPDPMDIACRLHDNAMTWRAQGEYGQAATAARRALKLAERAVGPYHPDVANILINLASIAEAQGDYAAAEQQAQRAVAIME